MDLLHCLPFYRKQSAIPLTEPQEESLGPSSAAQKASLPPTKQAAKTKWTPLRQRSGLFNSHGARLWLNAVTLGIYSVMLLKQ